MSIVKIPCISVIVPVYNVENYLPRCVDSILSQSFTDFELILVDDGSPDNSGKICDEYAEKDNRVRVFHKPNGGVSSARNLGLDNALGEFVTFIDSDDYVGREYLIELVSTIEDSKVDFVAICNTIQIAPFCSYIRLERADFDTLFSQYSFQKLCCPWGKLFRLSLIKKIGLNFDTSIHLGEDVVFVMTYLLNIKTISLIKSYSYHYEIRPGSLVRTMTPYEIELSVLQNFSRLFEPLKLQWVSIFASSEISKENLCVWQLSMTERVINSILNLPTRKDRVNKLMLLDWSVYKKYKHPISWKESIVIFLLKNRYFTVYDSLMSLKLRTHKD